MLKTLPDSWHPNLFSKIKWLLIILICTIILGKLFHRKFIKHINHEFKKLEARYVQKREKEREAPSNSILEKLLADAAEIDPEIWDAKYKYLPIKDKYKIVFVTNNGGEYSYAEYFKTAAERIGWKVEIYWDTLRGREQEFLKFDPDFVILTRIIEAAHHVDSKIKVHRSKKYILNHVPVRYEIRDQGLNKFGTEPQNRLLNLINMSHGMLIGGEREIDVYRKIFEKINKPFNGVKCLPLTPSTDYAPAEPKRVAWGGMVYDKFRSSNRYKNFITMLTAKVPMTIYGPYSSFAYLKPGIYGGYVAPGMDNIEAIRKNGIYLLTHYNLHIEAGVPSARLFEAAAANVITISDMHPFTMKHFGDSMLYFDHNASAEEMCKQVKEHVEWIKSNPEKAKEMANRAHKIFLEKFILEKDLARFARMHEYVLEQEKQMKLEYPLSYY